MTDRRTFLATLCAPLLGWLRPKPAQGMVTSGWSDVELKPGDRFTMAGVYAEVPRNVMGGYLMERPSLVPFIEFPDRIVSLHVMEDRLFVFTASGMYEVVDGEAMKLDFPFAVFVPPVQVPW